MDTNRVIEELLTIINREALDLDSLTESAEAAATMKQAAERLSDVLSPLAGALMAPRVTHENGQLIKRYRHA